MNSLNEKLDVLKFIGQIGGSVKEINSKVIDGKLKTDLLDIKKVAYELDQASGSLPQQRSQPAQLPVQIPQPLSEQPIPGYINTQHTSIPVSDSNQLELPFDKKFTLDDIFNKIDQVYRKIIDLEKEVKDLKKISLEEKKS
jgi:hypothetical protein